MINKNNKKILDELKKSYPKILKMTYIELGIFLGKILGETPDWASLGDAHDYLGNYKDEKQDEKLKKEITNSLCSLKQ